MRNRYPQITQMTQINFSRRGAEALRTEDGGQRTEVRKQGKGFGDLRFHSTFDIIEAVEGGRFPERVMMTFHPQRWTDNPVVWGKE